MYVKFAGPLREKVCAKCGVLKPADSFHRRSSTRSGLRSRCKDCKNADGADYRVRCPEAARASTANWVARNRERAKEKSRRWNNAHRASQTAKAREWRAKNPEMARETYKRANAKRYGKVDHLIRKRISEVMRQSLATGKGGQKTFQLLGCTLEEFKAHLERQFLPGMSWERMDEWEIDHIVPLASFKYFSTACPDFRAAWSLPNLRPLWSRENAAKGAARLYLL